MAGFWDDAKYDFLTLMARGAKGVVDAWRTSILTALDDEQSQGQPAGPQAGEVPDGPSSSTALAELEARKAELDSQIKAATPDKGERARMATRPRRVTTTPAVDEAQLKEWKKQLAALKKQINRRKQQGFAASD